MTRPRATALLLGFIALAAVPIQADSANLQARTSLQPSVAKLGESVLYRAWVVIDPGTDPLWLPPDPNELLTWGNLSPRRVEGRPKGAAPDTLMVEARLQAFRVGIVPIPGLKLQLRADGKSSVYRLPNVNLVVAPVLTAADSNADLRPVRGPIRAPWWERVPWMWVVLGLVLVGVGVLAWMWWRKRAPKPVPVAVPVADPAAVALMELAALRGLNLPAHGRFAEHAFHLTRILRRFLEAVSHAPRPGDTTSELLRHLEETGMSTDEINMLNGLLRLWDRVKFARAPFTSAEALRAEQAVELLIRRHAPAPAVPETEKKVA